MPTDQELDQILADLVQDRKDHDAPKWEFEYLKNHRQRFKDSCQHVAHVMPDPAAGRAILEIGAIPCHLTYMLRRLGYQVVSLDINPFKPKERPFIERHELDVRQCNVETDELPIHSENEMGQFGMVLFCEVFEHLRIDPVTTIRKMNDALMPGGHMLLTTPNLFSFYNAVGMVRGRGLHADPFEAFNNLHKNGFTGHIREYSKREVTHFVSQLGFDIVEASTRSYNTRRNFGGLLKFLWEIRPNHRNSLHILAKKSV